MPAAIIDDGYTLDGFIAPKEGIHDGLTFRYRPLTIKQYRALTDRIESAKTHEAAELHVAETIAAQLCDWDAKNGKGSVVEINRDNVTRMQPQLALSLLKIIEGDWASDEKPDPKPSGSAESPKN